MNARLLSFFLLTTGGAATDASNDCTQADQTLLKNRAIVCKSIVGASPACCGATPPSDVKGDGDWPNQAVYMKNLLDDLVSNSGCLTTAYAKDTMVWLNKDTAKFYWTWDVFQVQYYDMPRKPGVRIEAPDTLGRKCWAVAYLKQVWEKGLGDKVKALQNVDLVNFTSMYEKSIPPTMELCTKVKNNCFVNASYDPSRAGSCTAKDSLFYLGFERENAKRSFKVKYPFGHTLMV